MTQDELMDALMGCDPEARASVLVTVGGVFYDVATVGLLGDNVVITTRRRDDAEGDE